MLNLFSTNIPTLYPLKTAQNLGFCDVFRGYRCGPLVENGLSRSKSCQNRVFLVQPFSIGVRVCLYISTVKASSVCSNVLRILECTDQRFCFEGIILDPSSKSFHLIFHFQRWNSGPSITGKKTIWYMHRQKDDVYLHSLCISRPQVKTDKWGKDTKDKTATLI